MSKPAQIFQSPRPRRCCGSRVIPDTYCSRIQSSRDGVFDRFTCPLPALAVHTSRYVRLNDREILLVSSNPSRSDQDIVSNPLTRGSSVQVTLRPKMAW